MVVNGFWFLWFLDPLHLLSSTCSSKGSLRPPKRRNQLNQINQSLYKKTQAVLLETARNWKTTTKKSVFLSHQVDLQPPLTGFWWWWWPSFLVRMPDTNSYLILLHMRQCQIRSSLIPREDKFLESSFQCFKTYPKATVVMTQRKWKFCFTKTPSIPFNQIPWLKFSVLCFQTKCRITFSTWNWTLMVQNGYHT